MLITVQVGCVIDGGFKHFRIWYPPTISPPQILLGLVLMSQDYAAGRIWNLVNPLIVALAVVMFNAVLKSGRYRQNSPRFFRFCVPISHSLCWHI